MGPVDIILTAVIVLVLALAVFLAVRRRKTSSCCGNCAECARKRRSQNCADRIDGV